MIGDPDWDYYKDRNIWQRREKAVYAHMMERRLWDKPWSPELWDIAWRDNYLFDHHIKHKWNDYKEAMEYKKFYDHEEAIRDNAEWDYHHDNYIAA